MRGFIPPLDIKETVFVKNINDVCEKVSNYSIKEFTHFLDLRQKDLFISQCNKFKDISFEFFYGYEGDGQRCVACILPLGDVVYNYDYPVDVLVCPLIIGHNLTHRDFLGSLMSLMIKRQYIGDIIVKEDKAYVVVHKNISLIILQELTSVKNINTSFENFYDELYHEEVFVSQKSATVASMRLDNVLSAVLNQSRSSIAALLKQGLITINQMPVKQADFKIYDKDIISIKKHGKYKIFTQLNKSKKDRIFIDIKKY